MPDLTRRAVLEGATAVGLSAATPSWAAQFIPEPPFDIEGWFGPALMARIGENHERARIQSPDEYRLRPPLLAPDGRFNLSTSFRYALAKLLNEGPDVLCPDEPGLYAHYHSVLRKAPKHIGISLGGFVGELRDQPCTRMILLTRDRWLMGCPRHKERIGPFSRYQWLGSMDTFGFITPERDPFPRQWDNLVPQGRVPSPEDYLFGNFDRRAVGLPNEDPEPEPEPEPPSPDIWLSVNVSFGETTIAAYGPETVLGSGGYYLRDPEELLGLEQMDALAALRMQHAASVTTLLESNGRLNLSKEFRLALKLFLNGCRSVEITGPRPDATEQSIRRETMRLLAQCGAMPGGASSEVVEDGDRQCWRLASGEISPA